MKIGADKLKNFIEKVSMSDGQAITECLLNFDKDGLKVTANSKTTMTRVSGILKASIFKDYESIGNIGISDMKELKNVINKFKEMEVSLKVEGNLLDIAGTGKKVEVELMDTQFISVDISEPKLEFADSFVFTSDALHKIIEDSNVNKDYKLAFVTEDKKLTVQNTGKYKFTHQFVIPTIKGGVKCKFGQPLIDATKNLDGNLEISVKTDYPMKVLEKTEESIISIIIAPMVDNE